MTRLTALETETSMLETRTISISINRNWNDVYEAIWRPEGFPKWASGLSKSSLAKYGEVWKTEGPEGPEGPITIRFTDNNVFGVMDHYVNVGIGSQIYIPLRIIPNGDGAEVLLTCFGSQACLTPNLRPMQNGWSATCFR
jgi:hypothetical protein